MSFAIMLTPPTLSAALHRHSDSKALAILSQGHAAGTDGMLRTADGVGFRFYGGTISLDALSPGMCRLIFDAAARTDAVMVTFGSNAPALKVKGAAYPTSRWLGHMQLVSTPAELCVELGKRLEDWRKSEAKMQADGEIGPDDQPLEPSPDPGNEVRIAMTSSDVATSCDASERSSNAKMGWAIKAVVVSQNPKYGVVWRADVAPADDPAMIFRYLCWRQKTSDGKVGDMISTRPLEIFDPKQSIAPLKAEAGAGK